MKLLICMPAYNEEMTIGEVIAAIRERLPETDIVVINDGSADGTAEVVRQSSAKLVSLPCNLGYSRAVETGLLYAYRNGYEAIIYIDADGQHDPAYLPGFIAAFEEKGCDMLIGSRYVITKNYQGTPLGRRIGMILFSGLTGWLTSTRIYDTTSGMKAVRRSAMQALLRWQFVDFHTEVITYLLWLGYAIEEYPITVKERQYGTSMFAALSFFTYVTYPLSILLMTFVSFLQSKLYSQEKKSS